MNTRRNHPESACQGKERFQSAKLAHEVIKRQSRSRDREGRRCTVYRCPFCGGHHIGEDSLRKANRRPQEARP